MRVIFQLGALTVFFAPGAVLAPDAGAQTFPADDPVLEAIWEEGTENSRIYPLGQTLMDSIGPRLTGSPGLDASHDWLVSTYRAWGIEAENQQYGTWLAWQDRFTHVDLIAPRPTTLVARNLAWSPGTNGPVEGRVVTLPDAADGNAFRRWMEQEVPGAFVLVSFPQPTCRPGDHWERHGTTASVTAMEQNREARQEDWQARTAAAGVPPQQIPGLLEQAGAAGILTSNWAGSWGTNRVFSGGTGTIPSLDVECEDYGLLARLAENGQGPRIRVNVEAEFLGETPTFNTVGMIRGTERPDEYVLLSAHLDTWAGATGAPDNGTGRITDIGMQGFLQAGSFFARWLAKVPQELSARVELEIPGLPDSGRSDHASFVCHGVPSFRLGSHEWDYRDYTWHTNRDTFDKLALEEVRGNAVLTAMLAYLASEDPELVPRGRRAMPVSEQTGEAREWPECRTPMRSAW